MPTVEQAIRDAADAWAREHGCRDIVACNQTPLAAFEAGMKAERERLAALIDPGQLDKLADWFDADDEFKMTMFPEKWPPGSRANEVQQDLRSWARALRGDTGNSHKRK
jgi:hypothetical protein